MLTSRAGGLTATFSAGRPCGEDYTGGAVESDLAVVFIVVTHRNPMPASCLGDGISRTARVALAQPLGGRAVVEVMQRLPVPVTRQ